MSRDIPIIFSAAMVRAFLREIEAPGTGKTMTRRLAWRDKPHWYARDERIPAGGRVESSHSGGFDVYAQTPWQRVQPGDRLWVRENVTRFDKGSCDQHAWYWAGKNAPYSNIGPDSQWPTGIEGPGGGAPYNVPCIHMPRWASRITLVVAATKIERLQDISDADAIAEGVEKTITGHFGVIGPNGGWLGSTFDSAAEAFSYLWMSLHGAGSWDANPEVVALDVKPIKANIDAPEARAA